MQATLMHQRAWALLKGRKQCEEAWAVKLVAHGGSWSVRSFTTDLKVWAGSATCMSSASLDKYIAGRVHSIVALPWDELKAVLNALPTALD